MCAWETPLLRHGSDPATRAPQPYSRAHGRGTRSPLGRPRGDRNGHHHPRLLRQRCRRPMAVLRAGRRRIGRGRRQRRGPDPHCAAPLAASTTDRKIRCPVPRCRPRRPRCPACAEHQSIAVIHQTCSALERLRPPPPPGPEPPRHPGHLRRGRPHRGPVFRSGTLDTPRIDASPSVSRLRFRAAGRQLANHRVIVHPVHRPRWHPG